MSASLPIGNVTTVWDVPKELEDGTFSVHSED